MLSRIFKYGVVMMAAYASCIQAAESEPITIRFAHVMADDTPKGQGVIMFRDLVNERLAGKVNVEVFANSRLVGDNDELQALTENKVQMLAPSLSKFATYNPKLQVFDVPFLFDDADAVERFQTRAISNLLMNSMSTDGIHGLAYWNTGLKQFSSTKPIKVPNDAAGLVFRVQDSALLEDQFKLMGAKTERIPFAELKKATQDNRIQGAENTWPIIQGLELYKEQPNVTESNHGTLSYLVVSNSEFWNSLPFNIRTELESILAEVTYKVNQDAAQLNKQARTQAIEDGVSVTTLTPEQRAQWREAMQPLWNQYEDQIGADVMRAAKAANRRR